MDEKDIKELLMRVGHVQGEVSPEAAKVFSILVRSSLRYRDELLESQGIVLTVEAVRTALSWLMPALGTGAMPETDETVSLGLLKIWLNELRGSIKSTGNSL